MADISRRTLLGFGLSIGAVAGTGLLAGCVPAPAGSTGATAGSGLLPNYIPFSGIEPDYPALPNGTLAGFDRYPAVPLRVYKGKPGDGKPVSGIVQLGGPQPPGLNQNPYWQQLNTRVGSPMELQEVTAGADFVAKIATIQASGAFPDLMQLSPAIPSLGAFVKAKMIDLSDYLSGDKIKNYPLLANIPTDFWQACVFDGQLAGIPISRGPASSRVMFYRADLAAKLGIDGADITDFAAFRDALVEATDARAGRWGMVNNPLDYIRQMYSIPNNFAQRSNGSFTSAYENEHQKDALESARKLQELGVIQPDMASTTPVQAASKFGAGEGVFTWSSYTGYIGQYSTYHATNPAFAIGMLQVPGFDGGKGIGWRGNLNNNMVSIPIDSKARIETLLEIVSWLAAPFGSEEYLFQRYGIEGVHYSLDKTNPVPDPDKVTEILYPNYLGSGPYVLYAPQAPTFVRDVHAHMSSYLDDAVVDPTNLYYSQTYSSKSAQLLTTMQAVELDIIYGRQPVSAWDGAVRSYLDAGGTAIKNELARAAEKA